MAVERLVTALRTLLYEDEPGVKLYVCASDCICCVRIDANTVFRDELLNLKHVGTCMRVQLDRTLAFSAVRKAVTT